MSISIGGGGDFLFHKFSFVQFLISWSSFLMQYMSMIYQCVKINIATTVIDFYCTFFLNNKKKDA